VPQIENVTQIKTRTLKGGCPNGVAVKEEQAATREYRLCYRKAAKKEKPAVLAEFTRLTGYHRKSAVRLSGSKPVREVLAYADGEAVKPKPEKKRPANRRGEAGLHR
jgi:hypothetical protein